MENILIVKTSAIGDVIHALPVSYALKEAFPKVHITWAVEPPAYPLIAANPCVDRALLFPKKELKTFKGFMQNFLPFKRELCARNYDAALDLQGLFKSAAIVFFSGAKERLGTANMRELSDLISRPVAGEHKDGHIVERYLDVARALGAKGKEVVFPLTISERDRGSARLILEKAGVKRGCSYVIFAVGAGWPNKRWPTEYFAKLADWLYERSIIPVIVGGGAVDASIAAEIETATEIPPVNLVNRTSLLQLAYVIKSAVAVVGGDTGTLHLAAGLKTKVVMLMGPTDACRNGPYGQMNNAIEVKRSCKYCWKRACPHGEDCLSLILPEQVEEKLNDMLRKTL